MDWPHLFPIALLFFLNYSSTQLFSFGCGLKDKKGCFHVESSSVVLTYNLFKGCQNVMPFCHHHNGIMKMLQQNIL